MKFQIREGRFQGVGKCLIREYRMVCHVLKREISKDFVEVLSAFLIVYLRSETVFIVEIITTTCLIMQGCRAVVIDKDRNPKV